MLYYYYVFVFVIVIGFILAGEDNEGNAKERRWSANQMPKVIPHVNPQCLYWLRPRRVADGTFPHSRRR